MPGGTTSQAIGGTPISPLQPTTNFIKADPAVKFSLIQDLVKSWDLAASGTLESPKVTEEEMTMAEAFARGVKAAAERHKLEGQVARLQWHLEKMKEEKDGWEVERKDLQRQLGEALSMVEAKAATGLSGRPKSGSKATSKAVRIR